MLKTLTGLTAALVLALPASALADSAKSTETRTCNEYGDQISFTGSRTLWPPNHKYRTFTITATAGGPTASMDEVMFSSLVTSDEVVNGEELNGSGNTAVDASPNPATASGTGSASADQAIRSERSGRGDGRTYTVTVNASFGLLGARTCSEEFTVVVPHDQRKS